MGLGATQDEIDQAKLSCASQISFYGSTPAYKGMLEVHGFEDLHLELNRLSKQGEWTKMRDIIPDEVLQKFAIIDTPTKAAEELLSRYDAKIARVQPTIYTSQPELQSEFFNLIKS